MTQDPSINEAPLPDPPPGSFRIKWDTRIHGLEISFEADGLTHRSYLSWEELDRLRRDFLLETWGEMRARERAANVGKVMASAEMTSKAE